VAKDQVRLNPGDVPLNLLLFDTYILHSVRLLEFPELIKAYGYDSIMELLKSGALAIKCDANLLTIDGDARRLVESGKAFTYRFNRIRAANHREYVSGSFKEIGPHVGLSTKQFIRLKQAIVKNIDFVAGDELNSKSPEARQTVAFLNEVTANGPMLRGSVATELCKWADRPVDVNSFQLVVHRTDADTVVVESNICQEYGLNTLDCHVVIQNALFRMAGVGERLAWMERYTALCGTNSDDLPFLEDRLDFLAKEFDPTVNVSQLKRILTIKGLPDLGALESEGKLNLSRILEISRTKEGRQFRDWLADAPNKTDADIKGELDDATHSIGNFFQSNTGKGIRLLVTTGLGFAQPLVGLAAAAVDSFVTEHAFPPSGPISFINEMLPSALTAYKDSL
jgi:hypothetical protein